MTFTLLQFGATVIGWRRRQNAILELSRLSDRTLRDIGVVRADIPRVVDDALAAERVALAQRQPSRVRMPGAQSHEPC